MINAIGSMAVGLGLAHEAVADSNDFDFAHTTVEASYTLLAADPAGWFKDRFSLSDIAIP